ncbi:hypothetical protein ACWPKO_26500 (plasmid) [Coraliomargarita sp. W4R53]
MSKIAGAIMSHTKRDFLFCAREVADKRLFGGALVLVNALSIPQLWGHPEGCPHND